MPDAACQYTLLILRAGKPAGLPVVADLIESRSS
jgi:hypothetical protein